MKIGVAILFGGVLAVVHLLLGGLIEVQALGRHQGLGFGLMNRAAYVAAPAFPFLQYLSNAVLAAVVVYFLFVANSESSRGARLATQSVYFSVGFTLIVIAGLMAESARGNQESPPTPVGFEGWFYTGATVSAMHLVIVLAGVAIVRHVIQNRSQEQESREIDKASGSLN